MERTRNIRADVLPIVPPGMVLIPRSFQKWFMQNEETLWDDPTTRIIAVEREPSNFAALMRNTAPYKATTSVRVALWGGDGEVVLGPSNAHPKGAFQIVEKGRQEVRAITMETLMRKPVLTQLIC